jgi:hypothetical protein
MDQHERKKEKEKEDGCICFCQKNKRVTKRETFKRINYETLFHQDLYISLIHYNKKLKTDFYLNLLCDGGIKEVASRSLIDLDLLDRNF